MLGPFRSIGMPGRDLEPAACRSFATADASPPGRVQLRCLKHELVAGVDRTRVPVLELLTLRPTPIGGLTHGHVRMRAGCNSRRREGGL